MKIETRVEYPGVWLKLDDTEYFFNDDMLSELATKLAGVSLQLCKEIIDETIKLQSEGEEVAGLCGGGDRKVTRH